MTGSGAPMFAGLPIGAAVVGDGRIVDLNEAFAGVLRAEREQIAGKKLADLLGPEEAEVLGRRLSGEPDPSGQGPSDHDQVGPDKEPPWAQVAGIAPDGAPWIGEIAVGPPPPGSTERVVLLAAVGPPLSIDGHPAEGGERAHACPWEVLELDRILSHDVRGGLRGVNSFLTLLGRELGAPSEQAAEYLGTATAAGARTDAMVERLVNLLRLTLRPVTLAPTPLDELVQSAVTRSADQLPGSAPTVTLGDLPEVWASRALLLDALTELITNARKFADGPVAIRIAAGAVGPWAYVRIDDDGPGVEPNLADDAFLPYRLLQPKGRFPGIGMGLPTCRQIARAHGGRCWIEPHEPPGATVVLRLARVT
jgi:hypothetical protein